MSTRLTNISRILIAVSAALLVVTIFVPIWRIELTAPQYPEGLVLQIAATTLSGDVDVINGLNHYIGMRTLHANDFPEFSVLPFIFAFLAAVGLLTIIVNRKKLFYTWVIMLGVFGVAAMADFYRWNYNYGHNLDPEAPIRVPGMSYQPPLIGYKQLLNFGAYSIPDIGGWLLIGVYLMLTIALVIEWRTAHAKQISVQPAFALPLLFVVINGCSTNPRPIRVGNEGCAFCKMTITDDRFASELITARGKIYVFDDLHCLAGYTEQHQEFFDKAQIYLVEYTTKKLIAAPDAVLMKGEQFHSPMGSNTVAFSSNAASLFTPDSATKAIPWSTFIKP